MSEPSLVIALERRDRSRNMARFFSLELEQDLFGTILARRRWGRIGSHGRTLAEAFATAEAARVRVGELERIKRRRGYVDVVDGAAHTEP